MKLHLAVVVLLVVGCATAPVRDEDAERLEKATTTSSTDKPAEGLAYGQQGGRTVAPAVNDLSTATTGAPIGYGRRRRISSPPGEVTVPPVTITPF